MSARRTLGPADYLAGLQCERRLWLTRREPERAAGNVASVAARLSRAGEIRRHAERLFPAADAVDEKGHAEAVERTRSLLGDERVSAILGAAFEHLSVEIVADVLERLPEGGWRLCQVTPSGRVSETDFDGIALALFAVRGSGLRVPSAEIIHPDESYARGAAGIDWTAYFARRDVTADVEFLLEDVPGQVERFAGLLDSPRRPHVEPSPHCRRPWACEFRAECLRGLPADWVDLLPGLRSSRFHALREDGIARISDIPEHLPLRPGQALARSAHRHGELALSADLGDMLAGFGPPSDYLDFEAIAPVVPIYAGTCPHQAVPVGWSLHRLAENGELVHHDFLANGSCDPSREFAESLLACLAAARRPIVVYSPFESRILHDIALELPDLAVPLARIRTRLRDLQPVVRDGIYHLEFRGSLSLKRVASTLSPGFGYSDLPDVSDGGAAAETFERIARAELDARGEERARAALRAYCARDSEALVVTHLALRQLLERGRPERAPGTGH